MIKRIIVDWMDRWFNNPTIEIVDPDFPQGPKWPDAKSPVWVACNDIHLTFQGIYAMYFYTDGKPTSGYGGRLFEGTFTNGYSYKYKGAWSSRAACVNAAFPDSPIVDVLMGYCATAVRASALIEHFRQNREAYDFGLAWVDCGDMAPILMPCRLDGTVKNPGQNKVLEII